MGLARDFTARRIIDGADPDTGLAVPVAEAIEAGTPAVRCQAQIGKSRWVPSARAERRHMAQHPGHEAAGFWR